MFTEVNPLAYSRRLDIKAWRILGMKSSVKANYPVFWAFILAHLPWRQVVI